VLVRRVRSVRSADPTSRKHGSRRTFNPASPSAASLIDPATLMRIKSLQLRARIVVQGFLSGLHRSPHHGFSVEFSEYRQYTPGDDPRYLDWRAVRPVRPVLHQAVRGRDEPAVPPAGRPEPVDGVRVLAYTKVDVRPAPAAATLRVLPVDPAGRGGLVTFDQQIADYLPARYRPGHLRRLMMALERAVAGTQHRPDRPAGAGRGRPSASAG
jgi:hypothetical protein